MLMLDDDLGLTVALDNAGAADTRPYPFQERRNEQGIAQRKIGSTYAPPFGLHADVLDAR